MITTIIALALGSAAFKAAALGGLVLGNVARYARVWWRGPGPR